MTTVIPSSHANTVAPFAPLGRQPVGQESPELKASSFKALEQSADSARSENRRSPEDRPNEQAERQRVGDRQSKNSQNGSAQSDKSVGEKARAVREQKLVNELAAVDRDVHAHEQAHAAVGGEYAGTPTYQFVRGPDGVSYAVGGEVSISTGPIPNDPEATIRKARQIREAANAPADPSSQDRQVAAQATQLENEARAELRAKESTGAQQQAEQTSGKEKTQKVEDEKKTAAEESARKEAQREQEKQDEDIAQSRASSSDILAKVSNKNININRKLVEIGAINGLPTVGSFLNRRV